ncbi:hypothetical protein LTR85_005976 [Meristemomyces frigidus]|nr:hypothetical protein LTR85_005976 [Meristemomyces frigidus]
MSASPNSTNEPPTAPTSGVTTTPIPLALQHDPDNDCPACWGRLQNPTELPCGHVFCLECLTEALKTRSWCPYCRQGKYDVVAVGEVDDGDEDEDEDDYEEGGEGGDGEEDDGQARGGGGEEYG